MYIIACITVCIKTIVKNSLSCGQLKPPNLLKKFLFYGKDSLPIALNALVNSNDYRRIYKNSIFQIRKINNPNNYN